MTRHFKGATSIDAHGQRQLPAIRLLAIDCPGASPAMPADTQVPMSQDDPDQPANSPGGIVVFGLTRPDPYPRTTDLGEMMRRASQPMQDFYIHWDRRRQGRVMPARADFDPLEMVAWLPGIQILDVFHNPRRFRYRLVGEVEVETRGFNPTGRWLEDGFIGVSQEDVFVNYNTVVDQKTMVYDWGEYPCGGGYLVSQETIFLPLSSNGEIVDKVITFTTVKRM